MLEFPASLTDLDVYLTLGETALRVTVAVGLAVLVLGVVKRVRRRWVARTEAGTPAHAARARTLSDLLGSVARYAVWSVATVTVLSEVGFDIGPLLASAGVAGLAVGFGAQTLVKDVISGFFLLFDNTVGFGDLITFNGRTATVEYIGLRLIKARTFDGEVLMIPAGEMRVFGNKSLGFARAIVDVGLSYDQDVGEALAALGEVAQEWAETDAAKAVMTGPAPEVQGVLNLGQTAVEARIVVQVRAGEQFAAERDLRRLVKQHFDARGIESPFARRVVYVRTEPGAPADVQDVAADLGAAADEGR